MTGFRLQTLQLTVNYLSPDMEYSVSGSQTKSSLPLCIVETKRPCILGDCALGLVLGAIWEGCLYLDADFHFGVRVGGEYGDDFLGDLDETHFGRGWCYVG